MKIIASYRAVIRPSGPVRALRLLWAAWITFLLLASGGNPLHGILNVIDVDVDTRVLELFPNSVEGTQPFLSVHFIGSGQAQHSLLLFDLAGITPGDVGSATLLLDANVSFGSNSGNLGMDVFRVSEPWEETEATCE